MDLIIPFNRKFLIHIGQFTSKVDAIDFSVPQGSILDLFYSMLCKYTDGNHPRKQ